MKIWTVANQKGGVGKTTTTVTLGGLLAQQKHRVLLVDTDPHASLSYYFGIDAEEQSSSVYDIFVNKSPLTADNVMDCLCPTKLDNLFVLPASMALATLDRRATLLVQMLSIARMEEAASLLVQALLRSAHAPMALLA